ncbi:MAG TPA: hypothetical protein DCQ26_17840 [Marinilabiliales bacterium]|nr:MAG: hypothetical protein A2W96_02430 [Bacteroidetes bacterium GWD2_40_43]OFX90818.1 MAG: hypothetical protein A2W97_03615 [Bacteroidetes bacterium GWE2_40_63]OFY20550.1 MAG: hypothetical protein A2W88_13225 [Bacteroidetes bacterium GWF2_40_13]HAN00459.1 hypothetical protein [Marinilabiliales bacterium]HBO75621.1 hypothetical protein [Marinilabiliales bacterium]
MIRGNLFPLWPKGHLLAIAHENTHFVHLVPQGENCPVVIFCSLCASTHESLNQRKFPLMRDAHRTEEKMAK